MAEPKCQRGVIFDMDGVLVDSFEPHRESWRVLARELGKPFTDEQFAATFGRTSREIIRMLFGGAYSDAEVKRLDDRKEACYRELIRGRIPEMPGAASLLRRLHGSRTRLAIGSSGPTANVRLVIEEMQLGGLLDAVVTGGDVQKGKPDPQVFSLAVEQLGLEPSSCVVVEDAPVGIKAAHRAGCAAVGLAGSHSAASLFAAEHVVSKLDEITDELLEAVIARRRGS